MILVVSTLIATIIVLDKYDDILELIPGYGIGIFPGGKGFRNVGGIGGDAVKGGSKASKGTLKMDLQKFGKKGATEAVEWTNHGYKHFPQKKMNWKEIIKSTKSGAAKYNPGTDIQKLERMAWEKGTSVTNGRIWKVMEFDDVIGASAGAEIKYMRIEMSGGTIHGHPITKAEYKKLMK
ncbi:hypothetical protein [Clostridium sporogenes]|uniref:hypothetical protein n=1 Tax=Clostridium sporogenes TaxID=1509 RepID=UPI002236FDF3|nr:hypothetical protein [Clostridium sporogenes]MCW6111095.1 hypothetical protein [Clostridium sporogenes]